MEELDLKELLQIFWEKKLEIILINDGSTDKSKEIIESFKDKRIIAINKNTNTKKVCNC